MLLENSNEGVVGVVNPCLGLTLPLGSIRFRLGLCGQNSRDRPQHPGGHSAEQRIVSVEQPDQRGNRNRIGNMHQRRTRFQAIGKSGIVEDRHQRMRAAGFSVARELFNRAQMRFDLICKRVGEKAQPWVALAPDQGSLQSSDRIPRSGKSLFRCVSRAFGRCDNPCIHRKRQTNHNEAETTQHERLRRCEISISSWSTIGHGSTQIRRLLSLATALFYSTRVRRNLRIGILLFFASIAFQSSFITLDTFPSDEGIVLVAADDVANGRLLYRDTNIPLTPAVYLVQGLVFKLFGSSFLISRGLICLVNALCVVMVYALSLCFLPVRGAVLAAGLAIPLQVWMWPHAQFFSYNQLAIALCLIAMRVAWSIETGPSRRNAFLFGVVLAAGLWTKPNLPLAIGAGVLLYWLSCWLRSAWQHPCSRPRGLRELWVEGCFTLAGIVCASLPMIAFLASIGILDETIESVIKITQIYSDSPVGLFPGLFPPTEQLESVRMSSGLVLPGMLINIFEGIGRDPFYHHLVLFTGWVDLLVRAVYYTPVVLYLTTAAVLLYRLRTGRWSKESEAALVIFFTGCLLYLTNVSFPSLHYITPTLLPLVGLTTFCFAHFTGVAKSRSAVVFLRWGSRAAVVIYLLASLAAVHSYLSIIRAPVHSVRGTVWVPAPTAEIWNEIFDYTNDVMAEGDQLFAFPYFPMFYFLSGRDHPSRFVALGPGLPGAEAEDEIIGQLERDQVEFALNVHGAEYPGLERFENAYPRLFHYLTTQYELEYTFSGQLSDYADLLRRRTSRHESSRDGPR